MTQDAINGKKPGNLEPQGNLGIIEFGDDYTKGDKVQYDLWVKPGQYVDSSTQFGKVVQNDETRIMQSIFSCGHIKSTDIHNSEFFRLYPSKTSRHIIIENYALNDGIGYNQDDVDSIAQDMDDSAEVCSLLKDHLVQSTLPLILSKHEDEETHKAHLLPEPHCPYASYTGASQYNELLDEYFETIDRYNKKYEDVCSAKSIKSAKGTKKGTRDLGNRVMNIREEMINDIIKIYDKPANERLKYCAYNDYVDCLNLGSADYSGRLSYDTIKDSVYGNYYVYIMSSLQTDSKNKFVQEYITILKEIILNRSRYEKINFKSLQDEFNNLYKAHVNPDSKTGYADLLKSTASTSVSDMQSAIQKLANESLRRIAESVANDYMSIKNSKRGSNYKAGLIASFNETYKDRIDNSESNGYQYITDKGNSEGSSWFTVDSIKGYLVEKMSPPSDTPDYKTIMSYTRLARIANYIESVQNTEFNVTEEFTDEYTPWHLVKEEAAKIKTFWIKVIDYYRKNNIQSLIGKLDDLTNKLTQYAIWPQPIDVTIEGTQYQHWLFKNPVDGEKTADDTDAEGVDDYPTDVSIGAIQNGAGLPNNGNGDGTGDGTGVATPDTGSARAAMDSGQASRSSDNDPNEKEITIVDTEYWVRYFSLATVITLPFLADGLDIPPAMTPVPLPGIYIAFKAIHIKLFDVVLVIGLAIRGMYISPILLTVNLSDKDISPLLPLVAILKQVQQMFSAAIDMIEMTVPNLIGILIMKLEKENQGYREQNIAYTNMLKTLESQMVENEQQLKKNMRRMKDAYVDVRQNIFRTEDVAAN